MNLKQQKNVIIPGVISSFFAATLEVRPQQINFRFLIQEVIKNNKKLKTNEKKNNNNNK